MAVYSPLKSSVILRLNTGTDINGKMVIRSVTTSRIRPSVDATALKTVTDSFAGLLEHPVLAVEKVGTDSVEAE